MADIVLINPKFEVSSWGMEYALTEAIFLRPDFEIGYVQARSVYWQRHKLLHAWTQARMVLPGVGLFRRLICRRQLL